jgi:predicted DNA-binding antitoxin AbrB/MazE fold protein
MTQTVTATYTGGVLRPTTPLPLAEGETVEITVTTPAPPAPGSTEDEAIRRIREATTMDEWIAAAEAAAVFAPEDYDFFQALDDNRRASGAVRMLFPPEMKGKTW